MADTPGRADESAVGATGELLLAREEVDELVDLVRRDLVGEVEAHTEPARSIVPLHVRRACRHDEADLDAHAVTLERVVVDIEGDDAERRTIRRGVAVDTSAALADMAEHLDQTIQLVDALHGEELLGVSLDVLLPNGQVGQFHRATAHLQEDGDDDVADSHDGCTDDEPLEFVHK